jgi:hypothetical protein
MSSKTVMKLIDGRTGLMECTVCGSRHYASVHHGGGYRRGSFMCQNKCEKPSNTESIKRLGELVWAKQILDTYGPKESAR